MLKTMCRSIAMNFNRGLAEGQPQAAAGKVIREYFAEHAAILRSRQFPDLASRAAMGFGPTLEHLSRRPGPTYEDGSRVRSRGPLRRSGPDGMPAPQRSRRARQKLPRIHLFPAAA